MKVRGWAEFRLDEMEDAHRIELGRGRVISKETMESIPGSFPVYSSSVRNSGLFGTYGQFDFDEELISWSVDGGGDFFYRPQHKFSVTNVSGFLRVLDPSICVRFMHAQLAFLHSKLRFDYTHKAHPSVIRQLYRIALPTLPEQRKIAAILSSVDEAIEGTQAVIDQLQVVKKAMMADLLTRGIPGRHKKFKQTEIGEVPEDWEVVPMGTVATIGNGSTPSKARPDYWDGGTIPWLPTGKVNDYIIRTADSFVTEKALAECPIRLLPRGTVLVAMIGQGKTRGMVAYLDVEATINQNFAYVAPGAAVRSWFLFAFLNHVYGELRGSGRGSNQDALNCGILKAFPVPVPQVDEQEMIARGCFALDERIIREADAVSGLLELKSALMSVLLTGEVRVRVDEESAA